MMNFFEFVSDKSVSLNYKHYFNGFFINRIPLLSKLKIREMVTINAIWGTIRDKNINLIPVKFNSEGEQVYRAFNRLDPNIPYVEVGAGLENLLKVLNIQVFRRVTYTDVDYTIQKWAIKVGVSIGF
jgi:hypothetical protein